MAMMLNTSHLRSGQWTAEEERYAEEIIKAFHDGYLECDEGKYINALVSSDVRMYRSAVSLFPKSVVSHS